MHASQHACLLAQGDEAYVFYFTHPEKKKRSSIHVARLEAKGEELLCDRDQPFQLMLTPEKTIAMRGGNA